MKNPQTTKTATACQKTPRHYTQEQLDAYFAYEAKLEAQAGQKTPDMDEHDPLLAAYNDGDGDQTTSGAPGKAPQDTRNYNDAMVEDLAATHARTLAELDFVRRTALQAQNMAKEIAAKLDQTEAHAEALAEAIAKIRTAIDRGLDLTPSIYRAIAALANWEGAK